MPKATIAAAGLHSRRSFLRGSGAVAAAAGGLALGRTALRGAVASAEEPGAMSPDEALARLMEGNRRFAAGVPQRPNQSVDRRGDVAAGQHPFAFVLGCYDSRVSHELVFDQGVGDIVSSRTAGNLLDDAVLGGIEFGMEEFEVPLLLVLGHQGCGAVDATINALAGGGAPLGSIGRVVDLLRPAVEMAKDKPGDLLDNAVRANVQMTVARLRASPVLMMMHERREMRVAGGYYSLDTGAVEFHA